MADVELRFLENLASERKKLIESVFETKCSSYEQYLEAFARVAQLSDDIATAKKFFQGGEQDGDSDSP